MASAVLRWLLEPNDPFIRYHTLVDVLGYRADNKAAVQARHRISSHQAVKRILAGRTRSGYWPRRDTCDSPRFTGALWALILLGEMAIIPDDRVKKECERFLNLHQTPNGAFSYDSRARSKTQHDEPCLTGNMIRTLLVLGYRDDSRVQRAVDWMPSAQLDDGGWNCDYPEYQGIRVKHSSFMSTIEPLWAYSEIPRQKWTGKMKRAMEMGAEFLLMHRLYKADRHEWMPLNRTITSLHFPMYYYYDALHGLRVLTKLGYDDDERMRDAAYLAMSKRRPDGKWVLESDWFSEPGSTTRWLTPKAGAKSPGATDPWGTSLEGWKRFELERVGKPSKWITLNCYRALTRTGDLRTQK